MERQILVLILLVSMVMGYSVSNSNCTSYNDLLHQYLDCTDTLDMPVVDGMEFSHIISKSLMEQLLGIICRAFIPTESEKRCFRISCISDSHITEMLNKWGGLCGGNGQVLPQADQLLSDFQSVNTSISCIFATHRTINSCFSSGSSGIAAYPDPSLNITAGISWWETDRKNSITCSLEALKTMSNVCGRIRDQQINMIIDVLTRKPLGVGAYIDLDPIIQQLSAA